MKKLAVFIHFSSSDSLKPYERFFLSSLINEGYELHIISNSPLSPPSQKWCSEIGASLTLRNNDGFDFGAYTDFFSARKNLKDIDYLLLANNSFYGPIGKLPSPEVLLKDCDLFGWYLHPRVGRIPAHLQSYFLLFGPNVIKSGELEKYFSRHTSPKTFQDAIDQETELTNYFCQQGFSVRSESNFESTKKLFENPSILLPDVLLENNVPLIKRKAFTQDYSYYLKNSFGSHTEKAFKTALERGYPKDLIYEDLLDKPQSKTFPHLSHLYILSKEESSPINIKKGEIGLVLFVYFDDLFQQNTQILNTFIALEAQILIVSPKHDLLLRYEKEFQKRCNYQLMENRGRNEYAYFVCGKGILKDAEYTCLLHDKKSSGEVPAVRGQDWNEFCLENLVCSPTYVRNVIEIFRLNEEIGLLFPPPPLFSKWKIIPNTVWQNPNNLRWAQFLYKKFKLTIPFDSHPLVPYGSMFWVRKGALSCLVEKDLPLEWFPKEPLPADGSILHALERMYSMLAQEAGFFSGWIMTNNTAARYILNFYYYDCIPHAGECQFIGIRESSKLLFQASKRKLKRVAYRLWKKMKLN